MLRCSLAAVESAQTRRGSRPKPRPFARRPPIRPRVRGSTWRGTARRRRNGARTGSSRGKGARADDRCRVQQSLAVGDRPCTVEKGFETALGAASATISKRRSIRPLRSAGAGRADPCDPRFPEGVEALARHVTAPPELTRRLAQIGALISRSEASPFHKSPEARPAAGFARRRSVALGRFCSSCQCADRRRLAVSPSAIAWRRDRARGIGRRARQPMPETKRQVMSQAESGSCFRQTARPSRSPAPRWRELQTRIRTESARASCRRRTRSQPHHQSP